MIDQVKQWETLRPGDVVDIIAPASASSLSQLQNGVEYLRRIGLRPRFSEDLIKTDLFFAAPLEEQWKQLQKALESDSKVIWCLRGGYGSMRLIPFLENYDPPTKAKLLIGFSDITALHLYFNQKWNWPSLHGRTISQLHPEWELNEEQETLLDILFGRTGEVSYRNLKPLNSAAMGVGVLRGTLTGGNLRLIQTSIGTPWEIRPQRKILFIEDVCERGYSVDRMLEQLGQAEIMNDISALLIGDFTEGLEKNGKDLIPQAIKRFAQKVTYPVISGLPCGHAKEVNSPLPFNTKVQLHLGLRPKLACRVNN